MRPQLLDVRDVTSINEAVSRIFAAHGCIDVLVNNAGLGFARAAFDVTEADWDEMMAIVPCRARRCCVQRRIAGEAAEASPN